MNSDIRSFVSIQRLKHTQSGHELWFDVTFFLDVLEQLLSNRSGCRVGEVDMSEDKSIHTPICVRK